ncbi:hypothetical protein NDU88_000387 [Pleurodeles waltl]|uniref:Uncharacterized protein n=1 Tax=Pleurodeles waltl TaxID=8319 RepID=A0AAV7TFE1_PLEWA|nr:hypothetical protein NDU88_000387 [Pleurodeles waltl]
MLHDPLNPEAQLQPKQSHATASDDVAGNHREAARHTSNKLVAKQGKDGTRGTATSAEEEVNAPLSHA